MAKDKEAKFKERIDKKSNRESRSLLRKLKNYNDKDKPNLWLPILVFLVFVLIVLIIVIKKFSPINDVGSCIGGIAGGVIGGGATLMAFLKTAEYSRQQYEQLKVSKR